MNSKLLNSILNGALKPWLISFEDERVLKGIIKQVQNKPNRTKEEIQTNLNTVLQPFPSLLKGISFTDIEPIQNFGSTVNLPNASTLLNHYYKALIDAEVVRYFNATIHNPLILDKALDVPFQIGHQSLKGIVDLCNQTNNEIVEREFEVNQIPISDTTLFALTYLRNSLLALYFSIQEPFKDYLPTVYNSFEDFALYCLDNACEEIGLAISAVEPIIADTPKKNMKPDALSFGFKGDFDNLKKVVHVLNLRLDFLNESKTTTEQFIEVFTTKNLKNVKIQIHLDCATNEFEEIMQQFKILASKFNPSTIKKSALFYSKEGNLIDANSLYVTRHKSKLADDKKALISAIFQDISK